MSTENDRLSNYLHRLDTATDRCVVCGKRSPYLNDEYVCADCLSDMTFCCEICGGEYECTKLFFVADSLVCPECKTKIEKEEK